MKTLKEHGYDAGYAKYCDHTVLRPYTTTDVVIAFCKEAVEYGAASVCVNPVHVELVCEQLAGTGVKTATVIGFPLGANKPEIKAAEAAMAAADGADEVDMVLNIGALREKNDDLVLEDIRGVVDAVKGKALVKVIIETCFLSDEEKQRASRLCVDARADFVKTSTGMGTAGATEHDIRLIRETVGDKVSVKASGGVDNRATAYKMLQSGADRLGVSRTPQIVQDDTSIQSAALANQPPKYE